MNTQSNKFIIIIVATVSAGIPVWTVSQRELNLADPTFLAIWFLIGAVVTILATIFSSIKSRELIGAVTAGFALAIILRFLGDMFIGSGGQSLLGIEILIAVGVGAVSAWVVTALMSYTDTRKNTPRKNT